MAQMTIYLPDEIEARARDAAKSKGESVSRWVADQVVHSLAETWPQSVLDAAGAVPDFPSLDELRRGYGKDAAREAIA